MPLRGAFLGAAAAALEIARATGQTLSLLVIDVVHLKLVNDTFGHLQGDDVLRGVADILRASLRAEDIAARYAGDEFVALLPGTPNDRAVEVAERICAAVRGHPFELRDRSGAARMSLSVGVASFPDHGDHIDRLFAAADRALYQVKRGGRDGAAAAGGPGGEQAPVPLSIERFVGRVDEFRALTRLLEDAAAGRPRIVAISGEAGVGKTTLIKRLEPEVRLRAGALVLGRCHEADVQPPYAPWAEVITAIRRIDAAPAREWRELPNLVPALGGAQRRAGVEPGAPGGSKYLLLAEVAEYIRLAAQQRPIVIVLDDMQWADSASWDALEHLVLHLEGERVLICLTLRAEEAGGEVLQRRRRMSRDERFHELTLSRLTREELKTWVEAAFHRQDVGRELLAFLYRHTEGNPLFVVQVLRTLVDEGAVWHSGERWEWRPVSELRLPVGISDLISRRLSRLSPESHRILTTAAVIGREFDIDLAVAAGAGTEDELLDAIDEGTDASVIEPTARTGDRFAFTHEKLAEVLRESVNPRRLRKLHLQVAQAMERHAPGAVTEIAAHYDRAADAENAYRYALMAADRAKAVYAHEQGNEFLRIAERHATSPAQLAEVRVKLAEIAEAVGRYEEAEELCELAIEWFSGRGDGVRALPLRRMRERLRSLLGQSASRTLEATLALDAEARALGCDAERVPLLTMISQVYDRLGDRHASERVARECVELAERLGNAPLVAESLNRLGATLLQDDPAQAAVICERAMTIYRDLANALGEAKCHNNLSIAHMLRGDWRGARQELTVAIPLGRKAGALDLGGLLSLNLGVVYLKCGEYERAYELCGEALALFEVVKNSERKLYALYNLAHIERERDRFESAADLYEIASLLAQRIGQADVEVGAHAGAGLALLRQGGVERARAAYAAATGLMRARTDWFQGRELVEALGIRLMAYDGRHAEAAARFGGACATAEAVDPYSAIWLIAECADVVLAHDPALLRSWVARYAERIEQLGYAAMGARFAQLLEQAAAAHAPPAL